MKKKLLDVRVSRLLTWLWANFPAICFDVKFVPGEFNVEADTLSNWKAVPNDL